MTADFRALCVELTDCLEKADWPLRHRYVFRQWIDIARAALADGPAVPESREPASVTGQPSDEEIMGLMPQQMHEDLAYAARAMANEAGTDNRKAKGFMRIALNRHAVDLARAVLAHWGNHVPAPPADGEVAELVRTLTGIAHWRRRGRPGEGDPSPFDIRQADRLDRAAELLQRQVLVPVAVSDALIKSECALSDIAEGEPMTDEVDPLKWAERRCADTLAIIRPTMMQHKIRTSEWPPVAATAKPLPEVGE